MESKTNSNNAVFWVEIANSLESTQTIYVYYGKSDATTTSNGDNTFPVFLGHEEGNLNEWTSSYGTATMTAGTNYPHTGIYGLKMIPAAGSPSSSGKKYTITAYDSGYAYRIYVYDTGTKIASYVGSFFVYDTSAVATGLTFREADNYYQFYSPYTDTSILRSVGQHCFEVAINSTASSLFIDNISVLNNTALNEASLDYVDVYCYRANPNPTYFDDFLIRKYVYPEPTHGSWGSAEGENPPLEWSLIETWTGMIQASVLGWNLIETWTGMIQASISEWNLIETWTGMIKVSISGWNSIEIWTGIIKASILELSLYNLPFLLSIRIGGSVFANGLLLTLLAVLCVTLPCIIFTKRKLLSCVLAFIVMAFAVYVEWLNIWIAIIVALLFILFYWRVLT